MAREMNRRQVIAGFGAVSLGALLGACADEDGPQRSQVTTSEGRTATVKPRSDAALADLFDDTSACRLTPEGTEGPYYFDADAIRSDIREGKSGAPLRLAIRVRDPDCKPLPSAVVDIWHCDAVGVYSGFESAADRSGEKTHLRGAQVTNSDGIVEFKTIYPGWYPGRTAHIHAKVHLEAQTMLTTQLYFDDDLTTAVYRRQPYASRGRRDTFNDSDGIFDRRLLLDVSRNDDGYLGLISFDLERA